MEASDGTTRMVDHDRFVVLALDVTSASSPFVAGVNTVLVPRTLFLESKLWADFEAGSYAPLASATFYGEDLSATEVSEDVAGLIAGTLTGAEANDVLGRLLRNATDALVHEAVDVTAQAVVAHLPHDLVRILPWTPVANGPTGAVPQGFWEKIGAGATQAVNVLLVAGQLVLDGLVALGTFLIDLGQAVWDWGMAAKWVVQAAAVAVRTPRERGPRLPSRGCHRPSLPSLGVRAVSPPRAGKESGSPFPPWQREPLPTGRRDDNEERATGRSAP